MRLADIIRADMFWPRLKSKTKAEVIKELADNISSNEKSLKAKDVADILMEREKLGSTGIQDGIAIPHGKIPGLERIVIACGHSPEGIEFDSHDQKPTRLFFVLLAPEFAAGQHLKVLARLSRLLKDQGFRGKLMDAKTPADMLRLMLEEDEKI